jgi:hypothetical protein
MAPQPNPPTLFPFYLSFADKWGRLDRLTPLFTVSHLFPLFRRAGAAPEHPHRGLAHRMGRLLGLAGSHVKRLTHARAWVGSGQGGDLTLLPRAAPRRHGLCGGGGCYLPKPGGRPGRNRGNSHRLARRRASKARERPKPQSPSH